MSKGLKIIRLQAENIKKIVAVEITPDGNMVHITGRNGAGKTSVLDSIWWALGGMSNVQSVPIRRGQKNAKVVLDLGEFVVTRTFRALEGGDVTSSIKVENKEGARFASPQKMLDKLLGKLSFDPLAFSRMDTKEQFQTLRNFVPDVDFDAIDAANRSDFEKRTTLNRRAKEARNAASQIIVLKGFVAGARIDESALVDKLEAAAGQNADIETRKANREKMAEKIKANREEAQRVAGDAEITATAYVTGEDGRNKEMVKQAKERAAEIIRDAEKRAEENFKKASALHDSTLKDSKEKASALTEEASSLEGKLAGAGPLPQPVDVSDLRQQIEKAKENNSQVDVMERRDGHAKTAGDLEGQAKALTEAMDKRKADRTEKIAAAKIPVEGISFGEGEVLLEGLPFDQASDAEQLRASIAIAMAMNPDLKVIRIRDGSLLDSTSLKMLSDIINKADFQVWIERADDSGKVGFVLEDGQIKNKVESK